MRSIILAAFAVMLCAGSAAAFPFALEPYIIYGNDGDIAVDVDETVNADVDQPSYFRSRNYEIESESDTYVFGVKAIFPIGRFDIRPELAHVWDTDTEWYQSNDPLKLLPNVSGRREESREGWRFKMAVRINFGY